MLRATPPRWPSRTSDFFPRKRVFCLLVDALRGEESPDSALDVLRMRLITEELVRVCLLHGERRTLSFSNGTVCLPGRSRLPPSRGETNTFFLERVGLSARSAHLRQRRRRQSPPTRSLRRCQSSKPDGTVFWARASPSSSPGVEVCSCVFNRLGEVQIPLKKTLKTRCRLRHCFFRTKS